MIKITNVQIKKAANEHTDLQYPMGVEREYPVNDFKAGAEWAIKKLTGVMLKSPESIDVVGNCANCGVEYHIHKQIVTNPQHTEQLNKD